MAEVRAATYGGIPKKDTKQSSRRFVFLGMTLQYLDVLTIVRRLQWMKEQRQGSRRRRGSGPWALARAALHLVLDKVARLAFDRPSI